MIWRKTKGPFVGYLRRWADSDNFRLAIYKILKDGKRYVGSYTTVENEHDAIQMWEALRDGN